MKLLKMCEMKYGMISANEDDESIDSHDSEAKVSFDGERFFAVVAKNVYLLYVTS